MEQLDLFAFAEENIEKAVESAKLKSATVKPKAKQKTEPAIPAVSYLTGREESETFKPALVVESIELIESLYSEVFTEKRVIKKEHKKHVISAVIANLISCHEKGQFVAISRRAEHYNELATLNPWHTYRNMIAVIEKLLSAGYIIEKEFNFSNTDKNESVSSSYFPTVKTIKLFQQFNGVVCDNLSPVKLQYTDSKTGKKIECKIHKHTEEIKRSIRIVSAFNDFMSKQEIVYKPELQSDKLFYVKGLGFIHKSEAFTTSYPNTSHNSSNDSTKPHPHYLIGKRLDCDSGLYIPFKARLQRIFNHPKKGKNSTKRKGLYQSGDIGGRLYSKGNLSKIERSTILINGEATSEPDYRSLHINMLYHLDGKQCPFEDPYLVGDIPKDDDMRKVSKLVLLTLINAKSESACIKSVKYTIKEDERKKKGKFNPIRERLRRGDFIIEQVVLSLLKSHGNVSKYIGSDYGIRLQKLDSDMILSVLEQCQELNIPVIPVHDSVRCPECHTQTVIKIMKATYKKVMGFEIDVDL